MGPDAVSCWKGLIASAHVSHLDSIKGVQAKSKQQDPCTIMKLLLTYMKDKQFEYQEQVENQMAYKIVSQRLVPEGIRLKVNIDDDPDTDKPIHDKPVDEDPVDEEN